MMHAEEPWFIATGNDIADPSPQALQSWPQLQDVLSPAQAGEVQAQGQRGLRVEAGQAHLWTKTRQVPVRGGENRNAEGRGHREELPESFPVPPGWGWWLRFLHLGSLRAPCVQMTNPSLCELL